MYKIPKGDREDIKRIMTVALTELDIVLDWREAHELWEDYSERVCASWLFVPEKDEELAPIILDCIKGLFDDKNPN